MGVVWLILGAVLMIAGAAMLVVTSTDAPDLSRPQTPARRSPARMTSSRPRRSRAALTHPPTRPAGNGAVMTGASLRARTVRRADHLQAELLNVDTPARGDARPKPRRQPCPERASLQRRATFAAQQQPHGVIRLRERSRQVLGDLAVGSGWLGSRC